MFENSFNNIDKVMRNDQGLASEPREPEQIIKDMLARDAETAKILEDIRGML